MKIKYIVGVVATLALAAVAFWSVNNKSISNTDFQSALKTGEKVQIKGTWVREKECKYDPSKNLFTFTMKDEKGAEMPVSLNDAKPSNFEIATHVVVTGSVENGIFHATHVLTKCPSKYEANAKDLKQQS